MSKIIGVYKITNTVTGDTYIGSSIDVARRWQQHTQKSTWKEKSNRMYKDMQTYGVDKFKFIMLFPVEEQYLKQVEQEAIELFNPTYNKLRADGWDSVQTKHKYQNSDKGKQTNNNYRHRLCLYNGETMYCATLAKRLKKQGCKHPYVEAKKYLI